MSVETTTLEYNLSFVLLVFITGSEIPSRVGSSHRDAKFEPDISLANSWFNLYNLTSVIRTPPYKGQQLSVLRVKRGCMCFISSPLALDLSFVNFIPSLTAFALCLSL